MPSRRVSTDGNRAGVGRSAPRPVPAARPAPRAREAANDNAVPRRRRFERTAMVAAAILLAALIGLQVWLGG